MEQVVVRMRLKLRRENEAKKLPKPVQQYMRRNFHLLPEYLDLLRCFEYPGQVSGKEVRCINIFSPSRAQEHGLSIKTHAELEQHAEMLLFRGYIDQEGNTYVADRRPPIGQAKTAGRVTEQKRKGDRSGSV